MQLLSDGISIKNIFINFHSIVLRYSYSNFVTCKALTESMVCEYKNITIKAVSKTITAIDLL